MFVSPLQNQQLQSPSVDLGDVKVSRHRIILSLSTIHSPFRNTTGKTRGEQKVMGDLPRGSFCSFQAEEVEDQERL